jgi:hypothetical protein
MQTGRSFLSSALNGHQVLIGGFGLCQWTRMERSRRFRATAVSSHTGQGCYFKSGLRLSAYCNAGLRFAVGGPLSH